MSFILFLISLVSIVHAESPAELAWRLHETCATRYVLPNSHVRIGHCAAPWSEYDSETWICKARMIGRTSMDDGYLSCVVDPEPNITLLRMILDKDWLTKVAISFYGPKDGAALTQALCAHNVQRGLTTNCETIGVGQKLLLPPIWELRCENAGEANCSDPSPQEFARIVAALPTEVQTCVATLRARAPNDNKAHTVMLAKETKRGLGNIGFPASSVEYQSACAGFYPDAIDRLKVPSTFVALEAGGALKIVDFWGP